MDMERHKVTFSVLPIKQIAIQKFVKHCNSRQTQVAESIEEAAAITIRLDIVSDISALFMLMQAFRSLVICSNGSVGILQTRSGFFKS